MLLPRLLATFYFNPRAPCGARHAPLASRSIIRRISTHAPLAGRDSRCCYLVYWQRSISTHAPLAGRDLDFCFDVVMTKISTHAPLAGRDERSSKKSIPLWHFNPRAPCGARHDRESNGEGYGISTHAPLAGRDTEQVITKTPSKYFNPRAPCGARL